MLFFHFIFLPNIFLKNNIYIDDAFFQSELGWSVGGVVGLDLDCWRAGMQAPGSSGLK